jgi:DNA-binding GntR family transcriptional regulator
MWRVLRQKRRYEVETLGPDGMREVSEVRAQTLGQAASTATENADPAKVNRLVVGPPGCCGCVSSPKPGRT